MRNLKFKYIVVLSVILLLLAACQATTVEVTREVVTDNTASGNRGDGDGGTGAGTSGSGAKVEATRAIVGDSSGWLDGSPADTESSFTDISTEDSYDDSLEEADRAVEVMVEVESESYAFADSDTSDTFAPPSSAAEGTAVDANSELTAGEVDDNAQWDDYLLFLRDYSGARVIRVDVSQRHQIRVTNSAGNPVLGAIIDIESEGERVARLRTHSDGLAYFFPNALPTQDQADTYTVNINVNDTIETFELPTREAQREWNITHTGADQLETNVRLDVLFLIDATGSMGDEIAQLKENIRAISAQIDTLPSQPDVRFGMTVYRDQGDSFVSRTFDFTPDVETFAAALADVQAGGGGDYPEDLNEGLSRAIHAPEWRVEQTVSLVFLVADAPPHLDYGQENHYAVEMMEAAERGIKIYPIASSGLDEQGEYIFRQLAQFTGGKFIFLTYGAGGAGTTGTETTHNVEDYDVTSLDGLVIKIVEEELSYLTQ